MGVELIGDEDPGRLRIGVDRLPNVGDEVLMAPDAFPERIFRGTVYRIATSAEMATRTFVTEIEFDNAEELLRPGMIARARLIKKEYPDAITAPHFSILNRGDERSVFVEKDGVAHERNVQLGFIQNSHVLVSEGLDTGENLIVAGHRDFGVLGAIAGFAFGACTAVIAVFAIRRSSKRPGK